FIAYSRVTLMPLFADALFIRSAFKSLIRLATSEANDFSSEYFLSANSSIVAWTRYIFSRNWSAGKLGDRVAVALLSSLFSKSETLPNAAPVGEDCRIWANLSNVALA